MNLETFKWDVDADGIAHAIFDVPGRSMNTLTGKAVADIIAITKEVATNDAIKGLVLSSGKASGFCAGADLGEMGDRAGGSEKTKKSADELKKEQFDAGFSLNGTLRKLETCGKPVAVALNGLALGGGLEVALAGHYRVAANDNPKLQFGLPEAKIGLLPGAGGTQRLPRYVGKSKAMEMCLTGRIMDAAEAERSGLVSRVVPLADLLPEALKAADKIAALSRPLTMMAKEAVNRAYETTLAEGVRFERRLFHSTFATEDQKEGMAAFVEKRQPQFKHR